jgi:uncharacterized membrane protein YdbT with pleckstrin-like domain
MEIGKHKNNRNANLGIVLTSGESVILEAKKHPVGAIFILLAGVSISLSITIISLLVYGFMRSGSGSDLINFAPIILIVAMIISLLVLIASIVNAYLYNLNKLILTTEKIAQINYATIIDRKVIQLSIDRLQDITVSQVGIFPRIFKYGTLTIDTAGEQEDCIFTYAPDPYELSRAIMDQHEKSLTGKPVI